MNDLELQQSSAHEFDFLCRDFGFSLSEMSATTVTFVSERVEVGIHFEAHRSFELDVTIELREGIAGASAGAFGLAEVLRSASAPAAARFTCVQVTTGAALKGFLAEMAALLRSHGSELIQGDALAFRRLARDRAVEAQQNAESMDLERARSAAADGWSRRDYAVVVEALSSVRPELLLLSEKKRLEIARRRLGERA